MRADMAFWSTTVNAETGVKLSIAAAGPEPKKKATDRGGDADGETICFRNLILETFRLLEYSHQSEISRRSLLYIAHDIPAVRMNGSALDGSCTSDSTSLCMFRT